MQKIEDIIANKLSEAFQQLFNSDIEPCLIKFQKTHSAYKGDLSFVVFPFLKFSKNTPENTASMLGEYLLNNLDKVVDFQVVKGFLNISISDKYYIQYLNNNFDNTNFSLSQNQAKLILLEFSSPNTNKPLHLGHIRNILLGWSLANILKAAGNKVVKLNLVNNRGIHICKSILAYMKWGNGETHISANVKGDKFVGEFYVLFEKHYQKQINDLVSQGVKRDEAIKTAPLILEAQEILRKWEAGDKEIITLWAQMNNWVYEGFDITYKRLGVYFDQTDYESELYLDGKKIVEQGLKEAKFIKEKDGSVWADLSEYNLDKKILLRADGTSVYITQDIGTAVQRYNKYKPSQIIYVVGNEQIYHFEVLTKILKKLDLDYYNKIFHLSYGMVELPEGKMKTREGTIVDADDLMDEMYNTAKQITSELGKADNLDLDKAEELYNIIGLGALKYYILKVDPKKNMLFNPVESIDFNGNTASFIQYTYARINSLLKKAEKNSLKPQILNLDLNILEIEKELIKNLRDYQNIILQAAKELNPSLIANYIYELAKLYNQFYQEVPILKEENIDKKIFRLNFSLLSLNVIKSALNLLGISVVEKM